MTDFTDITLDILRKRFLIKDELGNVIETPDELFRRVAVAVSLAENSDEREKWAEIFYNMMSHLDFVPNTPTLANAGREIGQLSACLTGDTIIHTLAGEFSIAELAEEYKDKTRFLVYSCDGEQLRVGSAFSPRLTRKDAEVYEITMEIGDIMYANNEKFRLNTNVVEDGRIKIKLTDDHLVMMRDGTYKAVKDLKIGDSVMPFNHRYNGNMSGNSDRLVIYKDIDAVPCKAHWFVWEEFFGDIANGIIHHTDDDFLNNDPSNLEDATRVGHTSYHMSKDNPMWRPEVAEKISQQMIGNDRAVGVMRSEKFRQAVSVNNGMKNPDNVDRMILTKAFKVLDRMLKNGIELNAENYELTKSQGCSSVYTMQVREIIIDFNDLLDRHMSVRGALTNHRVIAIRQAGTDNVYDMSVDDYHNFAANGIFVHNCFVIPIGDSMEEIFDAVKHTAIIHKSGGGTGFSFNKLRPSGDMVLSTGGVASGPVSFMRVFDSSTESVKQGGIRRGANMGILEVSHPDIEEFIDCKLDGTSFSNFNISVAVDDYFMECVETNADYPLINPRKGSFVKNINAKTLFDKIASNAWQTGDPGIIFIDEINHGNPTPHLGRIESTNPCLVYETTLLTDKGYYQIGEVVERRLKLRALTKSGFKEIIDWIKHEKQSTLKITFDCGTVIRSSYDHKFMVDNVELIASELEIGMMIEKYNDSVEEYGEIVNIEEGDITDVYDITIKDDPTMVTNGYWSIDCGEQILLPFESCNLGSINLTKMLKYENNKYVIDYDKIEVTVKNAVRFLDDVIDVNKYPIPQIKEMTLKTRKIGLGVMGFADALIMMEVPYDSDDALYIAREFMENIRKHAFIASEELGIEKGNFPAFEGSIHEKNIYMRNASRTTIAPAGTISIIAGCSSGVEPIFDIKFKRRQADTEYLDEHYWYKRAKKEGWSQEKINKIFRVSREISYDWHLKIQAVFQRYTENAVSKTINLPNNSTIDDIKQIYLEAYHKNLKGITIYRDGSKKNQVFSTSEAEIKRKDRPGRLPGYTDKILTGCGTAFITINHDFDRDEAYEVFITMGKGGSCSASQLEAVGRMVSLALRNNIDIPQIVKQLRGIRCPEQHRDFASGTKTLSCSDAISIVLSKWGVDQGMDIIPISKSSYERCPQCGDFMIPEEGCFKCYSCGYSEC